MNCPLRNKGYENQMDKLDVANIFDGYESGKGLTILKLSSRNEWIMNSGCTFHMTSRRDWLLNFKQIEGGKVLMGNDQSCSIIGIGSIRFKIWDGTYRILENVRLVPNLRRNLISLGMLDINRGSYKLENGILRVIKGSMVVLKGILKQGLYILQGLGHIGMKQLQELGK